MREQAPIELRADDARGLEAPLRPPQGPTLTTIAAARETISSAHRFREARASPGEKRMGNKTKNKVSHQAVGDGVWREVDDLHGRRVQLAPPHRVNAARRAKK